MTSILDLNFTSINSPYEAEKHYAPRIMAGEMDLMAVKNELRTIHQFDEVDVRITANSLAKIQQAKFQKSAGLGSAVFLLFFGIILLALGGLMFVFLFNQGFISTINYVVIGAGLVMIVSSLKSMLK